MEIENVFFAITNNNKVPFVDPIPSTSSSAAIKTNSTDEPVIVATKKSTLIKKSVASPRIPLASRPVSAPATSSRSTTTTTNPKLRPPLAVHKRQETTTVIETKETVQQRRIEEIRVIKEKAQQDAEKRKKENQIRKEWENKQKQQEREMLQAFVSDRGHAAAEAERLKKERRKHSVLMNTDMMRKNREKHAALEAAKKQEEKHLLKSRREDFLKMTELRKAEEQRRRESLANRSMTATQQREIVDHLAQTKQQEEIRLLQVPYTIHTQYLATVIQTLTHSQTHLFTTAHPYKTSLCL